MSASYFISRRNLLKLGLMPISGWFTIAGCKDRTNKRGIPLIHTTDLYHPPQDPDDLLDLATVLALDEFDLKGVILDPTQRFLVPKPDGWDIARTPGYIPVRQISALLNRKIPVAAGPIHPLNDPTDTAEKAPPKQQAGMEMLLDILRRSKDKVVITSVGSARVITAAYNRDPELMRKKTRAVVINIGSTAGPKTEWNVGLDINAYVGLWRSGLPIHWYPCGTERSAFVRKHERGTYWHAEHAVLFKNLPGKLRAWITFSFTKSQREDYLKALDELGDGPEWDEILKGERNMWSTASLVMAAGRVLAKTGDGWRFLPAQDAKDMETWPWRLDPISAAVSDDGKVTWEVDPSSSQAMIFGRKPDLEYGEAMAEATNALWRGLLN